MELEKQNPNKHVGVTSKQILHANKIRSATKNYIFCIDRDFERNKPTNANWAAVMTDIFNKNVDKTEDLLHSVKCHRYPT